MALPKLLEIATAYCRQASENAEWSMHTRMRRIAGASRCNLCGWTAWRWGASG